MKKAKIRFTIERAPYYTPEKRLYHFIPTLSTQGATNCFWFLKRKTKKGAIKALHSFLADIRFSRYEIDEN